ncbi:hypothetical protein D3C81_777020 [compost metagenome]
MLNLLNNKHRYTNKNSRVPTDVTPFTKHIIQRFILIQHIVDNLINMVNIATHFHAFL